MEEDAEYTQVALVLLGDGGCGVAVVGVDAGTLAVVSDCLGCLMLWTYCSIEGGFCGTSWSLDIFELYAVSGGNRSMAMIVSMSVIVSMF